MKWVVTFGPLAKFEGVEVEASDRWDAICKAAEALGLMRGVAEGSCTLTNLASIAKVKKIERKSRVSWWERAQALKKSAKIEGELDRK